MDLIAPTAWNSLLDKVMFFVNKDTLECTHVILCLKVPCNWITNGFSQIDKVGNNANIGNRGFTMWKKIQWQNVTPSGNRTWASHSLWFQVQHYPFYTNLTFACKTETLGSLYSHALLLYCSLASKCQVSVERRVLDLESEVMRGWGSIPLGVDLTFCHWIFFT